MPTIPQLETELAKLREFQNLEVYKSRAAREEAPKEFLPKIDTILDLIKALAFAEPLPHGVNLSNVRQYVQQFTKVLAQLADQPDDQHYHQTARAKSQLSNHLGEFIREVTPGLAVAVALAAPLGMEDVKGRLAQIEASLVEKEKQLEERGNAILEQAKDEAKKVIQQAKDAAGQVALSEAQQEFAAQRKGYKGKMVASGVAAGLSLVLFAGLLWSLFQIPPAQGDAIGDYVYPTVVRALALTAMGAIVASLVRLFRSYLFLYEYSGHRMTRP